MDPLTISLAMGGAQYLMNQGKEKRQRQLAAETARYSPWTGMSPQAVQEADLMGTVGAGAMTGLGMQQQQADRAQQQELNQAYIDYLRGGAGGGNAWQRMGR